MGQFSLLYKNRKYLYAENTPDLRGHRAVKKAYGATYLHYNPDSYYFDLLDLLRRLAMTGGLILVGKDTVTQTLLGILVCVSWLVAVAYKK